MELAANNVGGVINVAGADVVTRYDLGRAVAQAYYIDTARRTAASIPGELTLTVVADVRLDSTLARAPKDPPARDL